MADLLRQSVYSRLAGFEDVNDAGRLVKHARYYWLQLAEGYLTRQLFASMAAGSRLFRWQPDNTPKGATNLASGERSYKAVSEKPLDTGLFCARRSGTSRSFGPLRLMEPLRQPILGRSSRKNGAGMYNCGVRETIMEILGKSKMMTTSHPLDSAEFAGGNLGRQASGTFDAQQSKCFHGGRAILVRLVQLILLLALMFGSGCGGSSADRTPASSSYADQFDFLWQTFDANYSYFVYKKIDWQGLRDTYRPMAIQATSQDQFTEVLVQMLSNLHDLHVHLIDPNGNYIATFTDTDFVNFNSGVWQQYLQAQGTNISQPDSWVVTGYLSGAPYIAVKSWASSTSSEAADLDAALEPFQNAKGIIIDVRMNGGGDSSTAGLFAGRFADHTRTAGFVQFRDGPAHGDFGPLDTRQVVPRGPWQYKGPVLLLIGRGCFSSNEDFITQMRELPNVTVVGDTSGGHSADPKTFNLSNGWQFSVSTWIDYTAEMQIIEDKGIDPAVFVPTTAADFQAGRDPVLDYALSHIPH